MNAAAKNFVQGILLSWDSLEPWENTVRAGYLADVDRETLDAICDETGDDFSEAEAQVMAFVRFRVQLPGRVRKQSPNTGARQ